MNDEIRGLKRINRRADFHRLLALVAAGLADRHQLWLGPPGKGKTAALHRHFKNTVGRDMLPGLDKRVEAPIYSGKMTPAKLYIRGWQHHLEPFLLWNDLPISRHSEDWMQLLLQFCEDQGNRTIRWDLKTESKLPPGTRLEIAAYLRERGLRERFLEELGYPPAVPDPDDVEEDPDVALGDEEARKVRAMEIAAGDVNAASVLRLPAAYETKSTVILVSNSLGDSSWEAVHPRFRCYSYEPIIDDLIDELEDIGTSGGKPIPRAVMTIVKSCQRRGEILDIDLRAVLEASEDYRLGEPWEDGLRRSFVSANMVDSLEYAADVVDWLHVKHDDAVRADPLRGSIVGQIFTERLLGQEVSSLRGEPRRRRREDVLTYLASQGWIRRYSPPVHVRPGARGRRTRWTFEVLRAPGPEVLTPLEPMPERSTPAPVTSPAEEPAPTGVEEAEAEGPQLLHLPQAELPKEKKQRVYKPRPNRVRKSRAKPKPEPPPPAPAEEPKPKKK